MSEWPLDPEHCEAIDTVLLMADAASRWGEAERAETLLDNAERILGTLPPRYARMRSRCDRDAPFT